MQATRSFIRLLSKERSVSPLHISRRLSTSVASRFVPQSPSLSSQLRCRNTSISLTLQQCRHKSQHQHSRARSPLREVMPLSEEDRESLAKRRAEQPAYELTFSCRPCGTRSTHRISKHGYHEGSVLVTCPGCSNRHIISDHLRVSSLYFSADDG
jgi:mitochondrial protein import protein ZIM17